MRRRIAQAVFAACLVASPWATAAAASPRTLTSDNEDGVVWRTPEGTVWLDRGDGARGPFVQFASGPSKPLGKSSVRELGAGRIELAYRIAAPNGTPIDVVREIATFDAASGQAVVKTFTIRPRVPITVDLRIDRVYCIRTRAKNLPIEAICPLKNGWARTIPLDNQEVPAEYRMGSALTGKGTPSLAIPMVQLHGGRQWAGAILCDPTFSSLYQLRRSADAVQGAVAYRYLGSRVPVGEEKRSFGIWLAPAEGLQDPFAASVDAMFATMLPDVPPGPAWLHEIAMVHYDYLSGKGQGWERDVKLLAEWLRPEERRRVALCLHGWYDGLGSYCYDAISGRMKTEWLAFGPSQRIRMTQDELRRRLRLAHDLGFRVFLYFGDGLTADSRGPGYHDDWVYRDAQEQTGRRLARARHVRPHLLAEPGTSEGVCLVSGVYERVVERLWDTGGWLCLGRDFRMPHGPDCGQTAAGILRPRDARPGQGVVGPGSRLRPAEGLLGVGLHWDQRIRGGAGLRDGRPRHFPGHALRAGRLVVRSLSQLAQRALELQLELRQQLCRHAVGGEDLRRPVAISNGWGDDRGPGQWTLDQRNRFLDLFRQRIKQTAPRRYLTEDPGRLISRDFLPPAAGDRLPAPAPGTSNWALAKNGGLATASSADPSYPPRGVIDGIRNDSGWGAGHGWASGPGKPLPQWLEVNFGRRRAIGRFIVITYERENSPETATKWGIRDYEIQAWDAARGQWETSVKEDGRTVKVRVHDLAKPVQTERVRLSVSQVAPADSCARVLQFEAWGPDTTIPTP